MKRLTTVLLVLATWPLAAAGDNLTFTATILMDPHMAAGDPTPFDYNGNGLRDDVVPADVTPPSSKQATVHLRKGGTTISQSFKILPKFEMFRGCDQNLNETRFLYNPPANPTTMKAWVPPLALRAMFQPFGVTVDDDTATPAITAIHGSRCLADPFNPDSTVNGGDGGTTRAGFLELEVQIRIVGPGL